MIFARKIKGYSSTNSGHFQFKDENGFSLIELLVSLAIMAGIASVAFLNLGSFSRESILVSQAEKLEAILRDVQGKAAAAENSSAWGVKLTNEVSGKDKYETFYGDSYNTGTIEGTHFLPTGVEFADPTTGTSTEIVFAEGTGLPAAADVFDLQTSNLSANYRVLVRSNGSVDKIKHGKDLVGYWKMDEASGTTAIDWSGVGNDGTNIGATINQTGQVDQAYSFGGDGDRVSMGNVFNFTTESFSYAFWIKLNSLSAQAAPLYKGNYSTNGWYANIETNGVVRLITNVSGAATAVSSGAGAITTGTWYYIVGVKNGSASALYINGQEVGSGTLQNPDSSSDDFLFGSYASGSLPINGYMDDVRVWSRALSAGEVKDMYNEAK